jgi:hypothetical protein
VTTSNGEVVAGGDQAALPKYDRTESAKLLEKIKPPSAQQMTRSRRS